MTDKTRPKDSDTSLSTRPEGLSRPARHRLKWMNHFDKYRNARLTCRHFGISPDTFYLWRKRFRPGNLITLEDDYKTRKPHNLRISEHKAMQLEIIKSLKNVNPRLGKIRIAKILQETGHKISGSTVGRILRDLESSPRSNRG
jgi:transposase